MYADEEDGEGARSTARRRERVAGQQRADDEKEELEVEVANGAMPPGARFKLRNERWKASRLYT